MAHLGRLASLVVLSTVVALTACGVGDDADLPMTPEPRICTQIYAINGTFTRGAAVPDDVNNQTGQPPGDGVLDISGCWPTGTWTFSLAPTGESTCATPPQPLAQYSFSASFVADVNGGQSIYNYTLITPNTTTYRLKVSSGGGGLCEGVMEIYTMDGLESWNLHPVLSTFNANGPLTGEAEYALWMDAQYP